LTFSGGVALAPSLAPDGKWFVYDAYTRYSDGEQVYLQAVGGLNAVCLTCTWPGRATEPVFSPDGEQIAFAASESAATGLYVMARDGSSPRRLTSTGYHPTWSPDGKTLAYSTGWTHWLPFDGTPHGPSQLWAVHVSSGETRMLYGGDALDPAWSPGGHRIAFAATPPNGTTRNIFTLAATGGEPTRVTGHEADDWYPTWSHAGDELYFVSDRAGSRGLWRVSIDERSGTPRGPAEVVAAPTAFMTYPRAGPAGSLVYSDAKAPKNVAVLPFDPATGTVAGALSPVTTGTNHWRRPHPSPDGKWLVSELGALTQEGGIYVVRRDGSGMRRLTHGRARDRMPRISPDGRRIVFESDRSGAWGIWVIDADGRNLRAVTGRDGAKRWTHPRWSPDGDQVAVWEQPTGRIALFPVDGSSTPSTLLRLPREQAARVVWFEWSPDGHHVALDLRDTIAVYSVKDATYRTMASPIGAGLITGWLPDGSRLLLNDYVQRKLILLDIRTWRTKELPYLASLEGDAWFGLSADGHTLAVAHGTATADIWMLQLPARP
jgi:Tol biopolymer transport system component